MKKIVRSICILLIMAILFSVPVHAEEQSTWSSSYFASFQLYIRYTGTQVRIWFDLTGTRVMDTLGVSEIVLERSVNNATWTTVKTYSPDDYPQMLEYNTASCVNHVTYEGSRYYYYRAYITLYAKSGSGQATMCRYTSPVRVE